MAITRKAGHPPLVLPSEANATTAAPASASIAKVSGAPGPSHVRVHRGKAARGAGVEHVIRAASPMALVEKP